MPAAATQPLRGLPLALASLAVAAASFMNILDTTIAIVALPTIGGDLGATPSQSSWVITIYGVCVAVILPLSGWITRRFGEVNTFIIAVLLFTVTSWLCAMAGSFNQLLLFRAVQGLSGGLLIALAQSMLVRLYPPEKQGLALAIWSITTVVAPVVGPLLGGYLTDKYGWPWIFLINVPIGLAAIWICWRYLRPFETERFKEPVDVVGLVLLFVGVICFQLVLDRGHELDWLSSVQIRVMLVVAIISFFLFVAWEIGEEHPVVDFSLLHYRHFVVGTALVATLYLAFMVGLVIYPIWLQTTLGYTATWSGIVMAGTGLAPLVLLPILGSRIHAWDPRTTVAFGILVAALAFYLHAQTTLDSTAEYIAAMRLLQGLAMPFSWLPLMAVALLGVPAEKLASAAGIFNFTRMLASSAGTAAGITLWDQRSIYHRSRLAENISPESVQYQEVMDVMGRTANSPDMALAALELAVGQQARTLAMADVFYVCVVIALLFVVATAALPSKVK